MNIVWKAKLPGRGASSPIVWKDQIYVTAFTRYGMEKNDPYSNVSKLSRHLLCIDRKSGAVRWKSDIPATKPFEHGVADFLWLHGFASPTPVADESGIYVYLGREGIAAFDHAGKERWRAATGERHHTWGTASSPIVFENLLIVHADPEADALLALDKQSGREVWRTKTGRGDSWSTPLIYQSGERLEMAFHHTSGHHQEEGKKSTATVGAVNPRNGELLWQCNILKDYLCPSPLHKDGVLYWLGHPSAAVRTGGNGDVTSSHVLWTSPRGSEVCSPVIHNGHLYFASDDGGVAHCLDLKTGAEVYKERLNPKPGRMYASGLLIGERIYYVSRQDGTYVIAAEPTFRQLAHNRIESDTSVFNATPAVSRGQLFLRSDEFLYCVGQTAGARQGR